jgi:hypothetical protein
VDTLMANSLSNRNRHAINNDFRIVCSVKGTGEQALCPTDRCPENIYS